MFIEKLLVELCIPYSPSSAAPEYEWLDLRFIEGEVYHRIDYGVWHGQEVEG